MYDAVYVKKHNVKGYEGVLPILTPPSYMLNNKCTVTDKVDKEK